MSTRMLVLDVLHLRDLMYLSLLGNLDLQFPFPCGCNPKSVAPYVFVDAFVGKEIFYTT